MELRSSPQRFSAACADRLCAQKRQVGSSHGERESIDDAAGWRSGECDGFDNVKECV